MRIFGSSRNSKASTNRATNVATNVSPAGIAEAAERSEADETRLARVRALEVTDEMPIVESQMAGLVSEPTSKADFEDGNSDVFVCRRSSPDDGDQHGPHGPLAAAARAAADAELGVTLFVYGWESVEPGSLSWAFPSLRAALDAVKTMRNAVEWCIVSGSEWVSVDAARAKGAVLIEQNA
jgi:hypothetical protein